MNMRISSDTAPSGLLGEHDVTCAVHKKLIKGLDDIVTSRSELDAIRSTKDEVLVASSSNCLDAPTSSTPQSSASSSPCSLNLLTSSAGPEAHNQGHDPAQACDQPQLAAAAPPGTSGYVQQQQPMLKGNTLLQHNSTAFSSTGNSGSHEAAAPPAMQYEPAVVDCHPAASSAGVLAAPSPPAPDQATLDPAGAAALVNDDQSSSGCDSEPNDPESMGGTFGTSIFFARVPPTVSYESILALFQQFGNVVSLNLFRPWASAKTSKGCGIVNYDNVTSALAAMTTLHNKYHWTGGETTMVVEWTDPSRHRKEQPNNKGVFEAKHKTCGNTRGRHKPFMRQAIALSMQAACSAPLDMRTLPAVMDASGRLIPVANRNLAALLPQMGTAGMGAVPTTATAPWLQGIGEAAARQAYVNMAAAAAASARHIGSLANAAMLQQASYCNGGNGFMTGATGSSMPATGGVLLASTGSPVQYQDAGGFSGSPPIAAQVASPLAAMTPTWQGSGAVANAGRGINGLPLLNICSSAMPAGAVPYLGSPQHPASQESLVAAMLPQKKQHRLSYMASAASHDVSGACIAASTLREGMLSAAGTPTAAMVQQGHGFGSTSMHVLQQQQPQTVTYLEPTSMNAVDHLSAAGLSSDVSSPNLEYSAAAGCQAQVQMGSSPLAYGAMCAAANNAHMAMAAAAGSAAVTKQQQWLNMQGVGDYGNGSHLPAVTCRTVAANGIEYLNTGGNLAVVPDATGITPAGTPTYFQAAMVSTPAGNMEYGVFGGLVDDVGGTSGAANNWLV